VHGDELRIVLDTDSDATSGRRPTGRAIHVPATPDALEAFKARWKAVCHVG
jgi:hypothetical protein